MTDFRALEILTIDREVNGLEQTFYLADDCETSLVEFIRDGATDYNDVYESELECVEAWAAENNLISSEEELTDQFESMIVETASCEYKKDVQSDEIMLNEDFSNWADGLVKDHQLHPEQYHEYGYVGDPMDLIA